MKKIQIDSTIFKDDISFHNNFSQIMGFPEYYGNNWDAWIDCMSYIDKPQEHMSNIHVENNENLEIEINANNDNKYFLSATWSNFCSCLSFVNGRFSKNGSNTRLVITEIINT